MQFRSQGELSNSKKDENTFLFHLKGTRAKQFDKKSLFVVELRWPAKWDEKKLSLAHIK